MIGLVRYVGSPYHKRNPGDFGLDPPSLPRPDKTLCDPAGIFRKSAAQELLLAGVRRGLVSERFEDGFPQNVWAVTPQGIPLEAQLQNRLNGEYHGYPLPSSDPLSEAVCQWWLEEEEEEVEEEEEE